MPDGHHRSGGVAITRETILKFNGALDRNSVDFNSVRTTFGTRDLADTLHLSTDGATITVFYLRPFLPPEARVRVTIDGERLRDAAGRRVDADGDGVPGGVGVIEFDTLGITTILGTSVCGRVFASEFATMPGGETVQPAAGRGDDHG